MLSGGSNFCPTWNAFKTPRNKSLADGVIAKLAGKYEQMLGRRFEGGVDLSGGEWQKLALARAYLREAQVLILDEPTAALDARAEFEVFERFNELTVGKMALFISHRFSTVRMAERIIVLENGSIAEEGSHDRLMARSGIYAEMFELASGELPIGESSEMADAIQKLELSAVERTILSEQDRELLRDHARETARSCAWIGNARINAAQTDSQKQLLQSSPNLKTAFMRLKALSLPTT